MIQQIQDVVSSIEFMRGITKSGVLSGLVVTARENSLLFSISAGSAVVSGTKVTLNSVDGLRLPDSVLDAFVVLSKSDSVETKTAWTGETHVVKTDKTFQYSIVPVDEYTASDDAIVIARVVYEATMPRTIKDAIPDLIGGYDLGELDGTYVSISELVDQLLSMKCVFSGITPVLGNYCLAGYSLKLQFDSSTVIEDYRIYLYRYGAASDTEPLRFMQQSLADFGLDQNSYKYVTEIDVVVDTGKEKYDFIRPIFSGIDFEHATDRAPAYPTNPHKTGFNDVSAGTSIPFHSQVFDSGFGIATQETQGIFGIRVTEYHHSSDVKTDWFGDITGIVGNKYLRTNHIPRSVDSVVRYEDNTRIPHDVVGDVVSLGPAFVGGSYAMYPRYTWVTYYSKGDRVVRESEPDVLYECLADYIPALNTATTPDKFDPAYWNPMVPVNVGVVYRYIPSLEYSRYYDNRVGFSASSSSIVSAGKIIESKAETYFDLAEYKSVICDRITVSMDETGPVASLKVVDTARTTRKRSAQPKQNFGSGHQILCMLRDLPTPSLLAKSSGKLTVTGSYYGSYVFFYTMSIPETVALTMTSLQATPGDLVLDTAQLIRDGNFVPRDTWEYNVAQNKIVISEDIWEPGKQYQILRMGSESPRSGLVTATGSANVPAGTAATATLTAYSDTQARLTLGDAIALNIGETTITKFCSSSAGYSGFEIGANQAATLANIVHAFQIDPVFMDSGYSVSVSGSVITFVSGKPEAEGNADKLTVSTANTAFKVSSFQGGAAHSVSFRDLVGAIISIDEHRKVDTTTVFRVYAARADNTDEFWHVLDIPVPENHTEADHIYSAMVTESNVLLEDTSAYKLSDEFSLDVLIQGYDPAGTAISETLSLTTQTFTELQNHRLDNQLRFVRSALIYEELTSYTITASSNTGACDLVVLAEAASGTRDLFDVCKVNWSGNKILSIKDARVFVDSFTKTPTSQVLAEGISNAALILQSGL